MTTVVSIDCDKRVLARWVREDGFPGLADLIEHTPPALLPSVLRWTAKHIVKHPHYVDEEALVLPEILWAEAEARDGLPAVHRFRNLVTGAAVLSLLLYSFHLSYLWT